MDTSLLGYLQSNHCHFALVINTMINGYCVELDSPGHGTIAGNMLQIAFISIPNFTARAGSTLKHLL